MLERLGVAGIVDEVVGPRRGDAAASVGTYIALAVANRVSTPAPSWPSPSGGPPRPATGVKLPAPALDHRRFWEAMDAIGET